jgi:hypothetical protein
VIQYSHYSTSHHDRWIESWRSKPVLSTLSIPSTCGIASLVNVVNATAQHRKFFVNVENGKVNICQCFWEGDPWTWRILIDRTGPIALSSKMAAERLTNQGNEYIRLYLEEPYNDHLEEQSTRIGIWESMGNGAWKKLEQRLPIDY